MHKLFQASDCIMSLYVSLAKGSLMVKATVSVGRDNVRV